MRLNPVAWKRLAHRYSHAEVANLIHILDRHDVRRRVALAVTEVRVRTRVNLRRRSDALRKSIPPGRPLVARRALRGTGV